MPPDRIKKPGAWIRSVFATLVLMNLFLFATACRSVISKDTKVQTEPGQQLIYKSDIAPIPPEKRKIIEESIRKFRQTNPQEREAGSVTIPVYFHILTSSDGKQGNVSCETVQKQIEVLNRAFAGKDPAGPGAVTPFRFAFAGMDITANDTWFNIKFREDPTPEERAAKKELNRGDRSTLNIYTVRLADKPYGWSRWPWDYAEGVDGVVVRYTTLPGGEYHFDEGDTATHEVGHWLGLFHTFEGGCDLPGDSVDDTPPQAAATINCLTTVNTCSGGDSDQVENFMNYIWDRCMYEFTPGQSNRMDAVHLLYRTQPNS